MIREYEWLTPLSANFLPVSRRFTLQGFLSPQDSSSSSVFSLLKSFFPSYWSTSSQAQPIPSDHDHFQLSFTPLYPTGMVQYSNKLECLIHRSHAVDDEKGLEEGLIDTTRARYALRIKYEEFISQESSRQSINQFHPGQDLSPKNHLIMVSHADDRQYVEQRLGEVIVLTSSMFID